MVSTNLKKRSEIEVGSFPPGTRKLFEHFWNHQLEAKLQSHRIYCSGKTHLLANVRFKWHKASKEGRHQHRLKGSRKSHFCLSGEWDFGKCKKILLQKTCWKHLFLPSVVHHEFEDVHPFPRDFNFACCISVLRATQSLEIHLLRLCNSM